mgnify:CR=1 FL=1
MTSTCPRVSGESGYEASWSGKLLFVRNAYRCSKTPTGPLDHHGLVYYIKQVGSINIVRKKSDSYIRKVSLALKRRTRFHLRLG